MTTTLENNNTAAITAEEIVDAGYEPWNKDGIFAVEYYDTDDNNKVMVYVQGTEAAAAITSVYEKRSWLGLTDGGHYYHYRPATDAEVAASGKLVVGEPDAVRAWTEEWPEEEVYVHVIFKKDKKPVAFFYEQKNVKDPLAWAEGYTVRYNGYVNVHYAAMLCDFRDCHDEAAVEDLAVKIATTRNDVAIAEDVMGSIEAFVKDELALLRLAYKADTVTRSLLLKTVDCWKNRGCVPTVKAAEDTTRWYHAVDTTKVKNNGVDETAWYQPLVGYELVATLDSVIYDLFDYAMKSLRGLAGLKVPSMYPQTYDFSFYTKDGVLVNVFSSKADCELVWFEANGRRVLGSEKIYRHWQHLIDGREEF